MFCHKDAIVWDFSIGPVEHLMSFLQLQTLNRLCVKQDKNRETNKKNSVCAYTEPSEKPSAVPASLHVLQKKEPFHKFRPSMATTASPRQIQGARAKRCFGAVPGCFLPAHETVLLPQKVSICVKMEHFQTRDKANFLHTAKLTGKFFK